MSASLLKEKTRVLSEKPIPEMFRTVVDGGKVVTDVVEHRVSEGTTVMSPLQRAFRGN